MAPSDSMGEYTISNGVAMAFGLGLILVLVIIIPIFLYSEQIKDKSQAIGKSFIRGWKKLREIGHAKQHGLVGNDQAPSHHGYESHPPPGNNSDMGSYHELQDMNPLPTITYPEPTAFSGRAYPQGGLRPPPPPRHPRADQIVDTRIGVARSNSLYQQADSVSEESDHELTPTGQPREAIRPTYGLNQDFSNASLVPKALVIKKPQSVRAPSSPIGASISAGVRDGTLRRTISNPATYRDARSSQPMTAPQPGSLSAVDDDDHEVAPAIPAKSPHRLSQCSELAYRNSFSSKPLPDLPPRNAVSSLPVPSGHYHDQHQSRSRDYPSRSYTAPLEPTPKSRFPSASRDAEAGRLSAYPSGQCLPTIRSAVEPRSSSHDDAYRGLGSHIRRPQRGHLPRTVAYGDLTALGELQRRQRLHNRPIQHDEEEEKEDSMGAFYESPTESDLESMVVHLSPNRQ
ncbi:hypothetical protein F4810DRAFT_717085 [Camillea tinctor]|nr:hypothetical protein F4810DRAFT_717085 [Camillea tinctor]